MTRFMLDEMTQFDTSKFAIVYIHENPKLLFWFFISCNFIFSIMNALVYVNIDQGAFIKGKNKLAGNEK